jgi:hypothetical protein
MTGAIDGAGRTAANLDSSAVYVRNHTVRDAFTDGTAAEERTPSDTLSCKSRLEAAEGLYPPKNHGYGNINAAPALTMRSHPQMVTCQGIIPQS